MKTMGIGLLVAGTVIGLYGMGMDTTVLSESGHRVYNIGLMQQQNLLTGIAGIGFLAGIVMIALSGRQKTPAAGSTPQATTVPLDVYQQALRCIRVDDTDGLLALLRQHEFNINAEDSDRKTLLHHAAATQSLAIVTLLLKWGASAAKFDAAGKLPEDYAVHGVPGDQLRRVLSESIA